jgi:putative colanic acid biosynthesis UDP-glucose lipid carrier transferase
MAVRDHLSQKPELDREVVGIASDDPEAASDTMSVMSLNSVAALALERGASEVLICGSFGDQDLVDTVSDRLIDFPIEVYLVPDLKHLPLFCLRIGDFAGLPCLSLSASPLSPSDQLVKRLEDVVVSGFILALIWPILLMLAVCVRLFNGPGPILFVQRRHGFMGRTIEVYKFRTMTWSPDHQLGPDDASAIRRAADTEFLDPPTGQFRQVKSGDARVTRLGKFMRTTSLDELPQFINVLKGDMSVVGPRPHARRHNLEFLQTVPGLMRRHFVKPGVTGLAQVSGARGRTKDVDDMAKRLAFDLSYIRQWSLWLDIKIVIKTIFVGFYNREP